MAKENYLFYVDCEVVNDFIKFAAENSLGIELIGYVGEKKDVYSFKTSNPENAWDILLSDKNKNFEDLRNEFAKRDLEIERFRLFEDMKYVYIVNAKGVTIFK